MFWTFGRDLIYLQEMKVHPLPWYTITFLSGMDRYYISLSAYRHLFANISYRLSAMLQYWLISVISYRQSSNITLLVIGTILTTNILIFSFLQCFIIFLEFLHRKFVYIFKFQHMNFWLPILGTFENLLIVWHHTEKPHKIF